MEDTILEVFASQQRQRPLVCYGKKSQHEASGIRSIDLGVARDEGVLGAGRG